TRERIAELFAQARREPLRDVELSLMANDRVGTCAFNSRPDGEGGVLLRGSWLPEEYSRSLRQVAESMHEMANLNRQVVQQKRALEKTVAELDDSNKGITSLHLELQD